MSTQPEITFAITGSTGAQIATANANGEIVGTFMFTLSAIGDSILLRARGTFVAPSHRNRGIAAQLWQYVLDSQRPTAVEVFPLNAFGEGLINSVQKNNPNLDWMV
jgi:GNAT superfamily N-acetyltransferase